MANWLVNTVMNQAQASNFDLGAYRADKNKDKNNRAEVVEILGENLPDEEKRAVGRKAGIIKDVERTGSSRVTSFFVPEHSTRVRTDFVVVGDQVSTTTDEESSGRQPADDGIAGDNRQSSLLPGVI